ncbi:MAG: hypothetical protein V1754_00045 [Pseudomonadota bacterium]
MAKLIDTLLLLALPASGKSEVRRYLSTLTLAQCRDEFHIGPTVQLDDFPYVHLMRRIDEELADLGQAQIFFHRTDRPFKDPVEWGTLIQLLNEDYTDLQKRTRLDPPSAAKHIFSRLEKARRAVGGPAKLSNLNDTILEKLSEALERESKELLDSRLAEYPDTLEGKTIVIEFARGGPQGAQMPLKPPLGYEYSLSQLSDEILSRSAILYVWVTPEESRRKNVARTDPNDPGSILHHGVPHEVMIKDYGCDDIEYLLKKSGQAGTITISAHKKTYHLPVGRFDNREDKTTFVRDPQDSWDSKDVRALHDGLKRAFEQLAK